MLTGTGTATATIIRWPRVDPVRMAHPTKRLQYLPSGSLAHRKCLAAPDQEIGKTVLHWLDMM